MNHSNLYIPDPQKWIHFFKSKTQEGRGLPNTSNSSEPNVSVKAVSPAEQTVEQAKSEMKRENINIIDSGILVHNKKSRQRRQKSKSKSKRGVVKVKRTYKTKQKRKHKRKYKPTHKRNTSVVRQKKRKQNKALRKTDIFDN